MKNKRTLVVQFQQQPFAATYGHEMNQLVAHFCRIEILEPCGKAPL